MMLRRRLPPARRKQIKRVLFARRYRATGPDERVRLLVLARSGGRCEFPGCTASAVDPHHRYERGAGGVGPKGPAWINEPANIAAACRHHNDWCSNQEPAEAQVMGWIVRAPYVPHEVPIQMDGGSYLLDDEGGKALCPM